MRMALTALKGKTTKRKKPRTYYKSQNTEPTWEEWEKLEPRQYGNRISSALDYYRLDCKNADYKRWTLEWVETSEKWKEHLPKFKKVPESKFHSTLAACCRTSSLGRPDVNEKYNEYWESLPGTSGKVKPVSESIDKWLTELKAKADEHAEAERVQKEEEKKKEDAKKNQPSIQERITAQAVIMDEIPATWLDTWLEDANSFNPKGFDFKKHFYDYKVTQAHARKIKSFYEGEMQEIADAIDPPKVPADATEREKDWALQLKEAYSIFSKSDLKKKMQGMELYMGALDVLIDTAKAQRKPRKRKSRSKEKIIAKLKFAINNDKFQLASINPIEIPGCNELWVFNVKTRKIGRYVAQTIDPLGAEREGTGLSVKGTTITQFNEEKSVQKTLRKPEEKLKEFKEAGKRKLATYLDDINAVDIKLNGRINPDTILLKVVR